MRAFVASAVSTVDLHDAGIAELASGMSNVLRLYARLGFQSFNLAMYGAAPGKPDATLALRLVARAYFGPLQRSDVMWSERLHSEAATDLEPERVAELGRGFFPRAAG